VGFGLFSILKPNRYLGTWNVRLYTKGKNPMGSRPHQGKESVASVVLFMLALTVAVCSCSTYNIRGNLDETARAYEVAVRWKHFETAELFVASSIRDQFQKRVKDAKDVEVADYQIITVDYDEASKRATVNAEITYSTRSSNRIRTLIDKQVWSYEDQKGSKQWRLMTLLPEFK
jgi:hypothetical protein